MKEIQALIDPAKLPPAEKQRLKRPKHTPFEDEKDGVDRFWIEMKELHGDLTKSEKWWHLGDEGMPYTVHDSFSTPWKHVLEQYGVVLSLMLEAFDSGALEKSKSNFDLCVAWKEDLRTLKEMFEKPVHQLHVDAFEHLLHKMVAPEWMGDDERDIERAKEYADRVCKDLMLFLEEHGNEEIRASPAVEIQIKRGDKMITVNGVTINMENQKVSHPVLGSKDFKTGFAPWTILRICTQEEPDGLGKASLETLGIAESDIHKKLNLINKHYSSPIVHYKNGMVYLDPDFKS